MFIARALHYRLSHFWIAYRIRIITSSVLILTDFPNWFTVESVLMHLFFTVAWVPNLDNVWCVRSAMIIETFWWHPFLLLITLPVGKLIHIQVEWFWQVIVSVFLYLVSHSWEFILCLMLECLIDLLSFIWHSQVVTVSLRSLIIIKVWICQPILIILFKCVRLFLTRLESLDCDAQLRLQVRPILMRTQMIIIFNIPRIPIVYISSFL